jgi:hypothetical protein
MLHVTISRSFAARFGHVVNHLLALRARQGASYSGGRLGVAAAEVLVASVLITFHPLPGPATAKRRQRVADDPVSIVVRMKSR